MGNPVKESIPVFAKRIKDKYPDYKDIDDTVLVNKIVEKYPEYAEQVELSDIKKKAGSALSVFGTSLQGSGRSGGLALGKVGAVPTRYKEPTEQESIAQAMKGVKGLAATDADVKRQQDFDKVMQPEGPDFDANDPIKSINKRVFDKTVRFEPGKATDVQKPVLTAENKIQKQEVEQAEMAERITPHNAAIVLKTIHDDSFPSSKEARQWLYQSGKQFDEKNETDVLARNVIHDYETVKSTIENNGGDLTKAAIDYYSEQDPQLKLLKDKGQLPPENVQGNLLHKFLQNKNVKEWGNTSQDAHNVYREQADNFWQNHPEQRINKIVGQIAQGREDFGYNNPFLNLVGVESSDKVIENLSMRGQIDDFDKDFYYKTVRPLIGLHVKEIPTSGLLENAFQSAGKGIVDIPKGVYELTGLRDLMTTQADRTYQNLEEDADQVEFKPKGINKITHATGNLAGVLVPISGGAKIIQGANLMKNGMAANQLMMGLTFYHDLQKEAEKNNPGDPVVNHLTALIQSAIFMKINKVLPNISQNIFKGSKGAIDDILNKLKSNEITGIQAKEAIVNTVVDKAAKVGGHSIKGASEMALATGLNDVVGGIFSGKFDSDKTTQNVVQTFEHMMMGMPLLNLATMRGSQRKVASESIWRITENGESFRESINQRSLTDPEFAKQAPELLKNLDHALEVRAKLDEMELKPDQKKDFLVTELQQRVLENKIAKSPSKSLNEKEEKEVQALEIEKKRILDPEFGDRKFMEEMYDEDLLPEADKVMLENNETGKFEPNKVGAYLKYIAQQANGLGENWEVHKDAKPNMKNYPPQIIEAANERWAKEIEAAQPKEGKTPPIDQVREMADENTPDEVTTVTEQPSSVNIPSNEQGGKEIVDFNLNEIRKPSGKIGEQGFTEEGARDLLNHIGVDVKGMDLKAMVEHLKSNPGDLQKLLDFTKQNPIELQKLPDGSYDLTDGNHRANLLFHSGIETVPTKIKDVSNSTNETTTQASDKGNESVKPEKEVITEPIPDKDREGAGKEPPKEKEPVDAVEGDGSIGGITHAANEIRRKDRALPEYQKEPQTFEEWNNQAEKAIKDGYDVDKLIGRIEKGHDPTPVENAIRKIYVATLDAEITKNPTDELLAKQKKFIEAGDLANSRAGRNLVSLKGENSPMESLSDFYVAKMEASGVGKLTEQQKKETKEAFDNVQKADENAVAAMQKYVDEIAKLKAENELLKQRKATPKKSKGDFAQQRKDAIEGAREALKKLRTGEGGIGASIPLVRELIAIAPHVKKYVGGLLGEGVYNLQEVVTKAYEEFKGLVDGITEKDIHNIIAGEHNTPRPTRNELAAKMRDLRDEAYYVNKLERLLAGTEPKNEAKKVKRNAEIEELKQKIRDFQKEERDALKEPKEEVDIDLKKLEAIRKRNEKQAAEIQERIKKGDFETKKPVPFLEDPEMQKKFPKEYKAALDAIIKKEDARHEFDVALLKDQMSRRNLGKKGIDLAGDILGTTRALVTGIDASGIGIQNLVAMIAHPRSAAKALPASFTDFVSAKNQDRWLAKVHNSRVFPMAQKFGLDITEPQSLKASQKEEIFSHNLLDRKIKFKGKTYVISKYLTKPFERIFTGLGNRMRWNLWERGVEKLLEDGYTPEKHPQEFESLAKVLNTETGRGKLHPQIDKAYNLVSSVIWSPRLMASRMNILGLGDLGNLIAGGKKGYYGGLTPKMREYALKDLAKFIAFGSTMLALAGLSFADDVETDPNSSTFGTFSADGRRYNIWGGFTQYVRLVTKLWQGGENQKDGFKKSGQLRTALRFIWSKTTPVVGTAIGWGNKDRSGNPRDYMGQPMTAEGSLESTLVPLSIRGIIKGLENEGLKSVIWTGVPSFVGMNVNYESDFEDSADKSRTREKRSPREPAKRERVGRE